MTRRTNPAVRCGAILLLFGGCGSAPPVSPEVVALHEARLLGPFQEERTVVCNDLQLDITANFDHEVARPTVNSAVQDFSRAEKDGAVELRWLNRGGLQTPLTFQIGKVKFVALLTATLHVRERGEFTMNACASGQVTEAEGSSELRNWSEIRIADGVYRSR